MILSSITSWFNQKEVLLLELGNCVVKVSLYAIKGSSVLVKEEFSFPINSYHNCKVRDKKCFIEEIIKGTKEISIPNNVLVGIDSSHFEHKCFQFEKGKDKFGILSKIESVEQKRILYSNFKQDKVSVILIHNRILEDLAINLVEAGIKMSKFVPIKSFVPENGPRGIIDLGYRTTNVLILDGDFVVHYKTLEIGIERVLMSVAQKFSISIEEAMVALLEVDLLELQNVSWISVGELKLNRYNFSSFLKVYLEALLKKILVGPIAELKELTLVGWGCKIKGINQLLEKYKCNLATIEKSELIVRMC